MKRGHALEERRQLRAKAVDLADQLADAAGMHARLYGQGSPMHQLLGQAAMMLRQMTRELRIPYSRRWRGDIK